MSVSADSIFSSEDVKQQSNMPDMKNSSASMEALGPKILFKVRCSYRS